VGLLLNPYF